MDVLWTLGKLELARAAVTRWWAHFHMTLSQLHSYTLTLLHSNTLTLLHSYTLTLLHSYTLTL